MSDWQKVKLGDVAEVLGGSTPKTSEKSFWDGDIPWITPNDLANYKFILFLFQRVTRSVIVSLY